MGNDLVVSYLDEWKIPIAPPRGGGGTEDQVTAVISRLPFACQQPLRRVEEWEKVQGTLLSLGWETAPKDR